MIAAVSGGSDALQGGSESVTTAPVMTEEVTCGSQGSDAPSAQDRVSGRVNAGRGAQGTDLVSQTRPDAVVFQGVDNVVVSEEAECLFDIVDGWVRRLSLQDE